MNGNDYWGVDCMTIVPVTENAYRRKIRRRLTLDLFTRYGTFWTYVDALRDQWCVSPTIGVPSEPAFHTEVVGLLTQYQMPERFHMPTASAIPETDVAALEALGTPAETIQFLRRADARINVAFFLKCLTVIWKHEVARPHEPDGDWRHGANVTGWMSWVPFLSACVLYHPPPDKLLEFADHDDDNAAALPLTTVSQDGDTREEAALHLAAFLNGNISSLMRYGESLRTSYYESDASTPRGKRGRPPDPLLDVQCAMWRAKGVSSADIARLIGRNVRDNQGDYGPEHPSYRERSDAVEDAVNRGNDILTARNVTRE